MSTNRSTRRSHSCWKTFFRKLSVLARTVYRISSPRDGGRIEVSYWESEKGSWNMTWCCPGDKRVLSVRLAIALNRRNSYQWLPTLASPVNRSRRDRSSCGSELFITNVTPTSALSSCLFSNSVTSARYQSHESKAKKQSNALATDSFSMSTE